jgi:hypothetical protein
MVPRHWPGNASECDHVIKDTMAKAGFESAVDQESDDATVLDDEVMVIGNRLRGLDMSELPLSTVLDRMGELSKAKSHEMKEEELDDGNPG